MDEVFDINPQLRILICRDCRYAVPPTQCRTHLAKRHQKLSKSRRRAILSAVQQQHHALAQTIQEIQYPNPREPSIHGIPLYTNGLACRQILEGALSQCRFVCTDVKAMQRHCSRIHSWANQQQRGGNKALQSRHTPNKIWEEGITYQRLFVEPHWKRLFEVNAADESTRDEAQTSKPSSSADFFEEQKKILEESILLDSKPQELVHGWAHPSAVVPWLQKTGIWEHLHPLKKEEISAATLPVRPDESPVLKEQCSLLEKALRRAHSKALSGEDGGLSWPCKVLLSQFAGDGNQGSGKTRHFEPYKQPETLKKYFGISHRFLCYLARVYFSNDAFFKASGVAPEGTKLPQDMMDITSRQRQCWDRLQSVTTTYLDQNRTVETGLAVEEALLHLLKSLIEHDTGPKRYGSPIVSFCAMLALERQSGSWMLPNNFNSQLSGVIWIAQLVIFCIDSIEAEAHGCTAIDYIKDTCDLFLKQTTETPMGELLRWRLLLFNVARHSISDREATWDDSQSTVTFGDTQLRMKDITRLVTSEYRACERIMTEELLLGDIQLTRLSSAHLRDNQGITTEGYNFKQDPANEQILAKSGTALFLHIKQSAYLAKLFIRSGEGAPDEVACWRPNALASYQSSVQAFLQHLCVLIHISSGQPLRATELFSITVRNTMRKRAVVIHNGRVMLHTQYHKTQQTTGQFKDNIRFLPQAVGDLLVRYIVYIMPLYHLFTNSRSSKGSTSSEYLFQKDGRPWSADALSSSLRASTTRAQIATLHVSNWRQISVAIVKTKFATHLDVFDASNDDEENEEISAEIRAMTKQRNHTVRTANTAYSNSSGASYGGAWDGLIRTGKMASDLWQGLFSISSLQQTQRKRQLDEDDCRLIDRLERAAPRIPRQWDSEHLKEQMRRLFRNQFMDWKSDQQRDALGLIMAGREQVVAILPTGAGKSLLFLLPAALPDRRTTIVIVPLVALRGDLLRRISELGISFIEWHMGERREAPIVLISAEAAATKDFAQYAEELTLARRLDRVVFDECHLTVTAREYRESLKAITNLRRLRTQFVYLTATLPPSLWTEFLYNNYLDKVSIVRCSSNRSNAIYTTTYTLPGQGSLKQQAANLVRQMWSELGCVDQSRDKIIIYAPTLGDVENLAGLLDCQSFTSKSGSPVEKQASLARWISDSGQPFIVATSALAEGFDYAHVRCIVFVGQPESIITFAQACGRGGRDGRPYHATVLLPYGCQLRYDPELDTVSRATLRLDRSQAKARERAAMQNYLAARHCFRTSLSDYLDEAKDRRWCMEGEDEPCGVCELGHKESIQQHPMQQGTEDGLYRGKTLIQQQKLGELTDLERYREDLAAVVGQCMICCVRNTRDYDHPLDSCHRRAEFFEAKRETLKRYKAIGRPWIKSYAACFNCYNLQEICPCPVPGSSTRDCEFKDIVLPLSYALGTEKTANEWILREFQREFHDIPSYMDWLGESTEFGGFPAIQAVRITARFLELFLRPK